jgi:hypothetical protein
MVSTGQQEPSMSPWLIFQILAIATMPAAYDMARARNRWANAWLGTAMIIGPLALAALLVLGKRKGEAIGMKGR